MGPTLNGFKGYIIAGSRSSQSADEPEDESGESTRDCSASGTLVAPAFLFVCGAAAQERVVVSVAVLPVLLALQAEIVAQVDSIVVVVIACD